MSGLNFNEADPHKRAGYTIKCRGERASDGRVHPKHFVTKETHRAHSAYLSKFAYRFAEETKIARKMRRKSYKIGCATDRLEEICDAIFIDAVQDLVGWELELLKLLSVCDDLNVICVGEFWQTIYQTANVQKNQRAMMTSYRIFRRLDSRNPA